MSNKEKKTKDENSTATTVSDSISETTNNSRTYGRSVSFSSVNFRSYVRDVGDHPDCRSGPPISIGWEHFHNEFFDVDDYEQKRLPRRNGMELVIPPEARSQMLKKSGLSLNDIVAAERVAKKTQHQRRVTVATLPWSQHEEYAQFFRRKFKKFFSKQTSQQDLICKEWSKNTGKKKIDEENHLHNNDDDVKC